MPMQLKPLPDAVEHGDIPAFQDFGQGGKKGYNSTLPRANTFG